MGPLRILVTDMETQQLFEYDKEIRTLHPIFCGLDEAGRGPLAGDVYAAAVVFDDGVCIEGLNDSKKLTEKKRELLFDEIINKAKAFCIATASVEEIEELNILNAAMLAMKRAYEGLDIKPDYALADGNKFPPLGIAGEAVVKGDGTSASIAAASVLAKTARDRYMKARLRMYDTRVWLTHANALVDSREMVELKHELLTRRQKLRARMEYSVGSIHEMKGEALKNMSKLGNNAYQLEQIIRKIEAMNPVFK